MTEKFHFNFSLSCIGERNGNPLQCSCLENPRNGGAWWAAVYGVAQSQTWLKRLSSSSSSPCSPFFFPFNSDSRKVALEMQGVGWGRVLSSGIRCSGVAFPNQQHLETLLRAPTAAPPTVRNPLHFPPTHCPQPQCLLPGSLKTGLRIIQQNVWVFSNSLSDPPQSRIKKDGTGMIVSTLLMKRQAQTG